MAMTADLSASSQFGMSTAEDPMELVSDMDRRPAIDEDNDIDLDLTGEQPNGDDDDYMIEDATSVPDQQVYRENLLQAGNDDEMVDEVDNTPEDEDSMPINDEDLDDAAVSVQEFNTDPVAEVYHTDIPQQDPGSFEHDARREEPAESGLTYDQHVVAEQDDLSKHGVPVIETLSESNTPKPDSETNAIDQAETDTIHEGGDSLETVAAGSNVPNNSGDSALPGVTEPNMGALQPDEDPGIHTSPDRVDASRNDGSTRLNSPQPVPSRVHPVVVVYQNTEISLFPPAEQNQESSQTFFLQDEKLAGQSISKLLEACRIVLDESIGEEDELEIRIEELGLFINEVRHPACSRSLLAYVFFLQGAVESHTTTLTQIIDTYLQLQRQDGFDNPGPLYLTLSTRINFSYRFASLVTAAAQGKGLSQLHIWESPEDSDELSDVQEGQNFVGAAEALTEDFASAKVDAGPPAEDPRKGDTERRPCTSLEDHGFTSASQDIVAEAEPLHAFEAGVTPRTQESPAAATTTDELNAHNHDTIDGTDQGHKQTTSDPVTNEDRQAIQGSQSTSLPAEPGSENADIIEYEEEDDVDQEASVGSSTLQGDVSEAAAGKAQLHYPRPIYTADSNHSTVAEEVSEEKTEVSYSLDEQLSPVGDVFQGDHDIACGIEEDIGDDDAFSAQDGAHDELTESKNEEHGQQHSDHQHEYHEEEQLDFDRSPQYPNHGVLQATNEDDVIDLEHPTSSKSKNEQGYGQANTDQFSTVDADEALRQRSLYHEQHFHEGTNGVDTAEPVIAGERIEDRLNQGEDTGVVDPTVPAVRFGDGTHSLLIPATDIDEITYEDEEIEEPTEKDATESEVNSNPKSLVSKANLKRVRSSPEEDNALETDFPGRSPKYLTL